MKKLMVVLSLIAAGIFRSSWGSITFGKGRVPRSRVLLSGL
ncbi:KLK6 isoform 7 [Pan troglodytes]|uniref:KLK6 isoform 4 n=3 Tax=Hominidae TaxID=9604 RepID=A0A2J8U938_PONAB|nr:KLK6 isoform 4 [Pan troglodytes]PNI91886.1 KLK6 isoform 7 [Pan troglodytes]PNJ41776.1 KLK6 isoform 4 [Pongo abelii]PNJ41779.1 KLK6 isoform 7 [Pongo abelii]